MEEKYGEGKTTEMESRHVGTAGLGVLKEEEK